MKYKFIKENHSKFSVKEMCQILKVSRSGYYYWCRYSKSKRSIETEYILTNIRNEYEKSRQLYGSPKITFELNKKGIICSRPRVARIMKANGIKSITKKKFVITTDSKHKRKVAPNLVNQNFSANVPNQLWLGDITYIKTLNGWLYLATVLDVFSRKIIGWSMSKSMTRHLVINALKDALNKRSPSENLVFHSDRGSQYASDDFVKLLTKNSIIQSMSSSGNCYDNAMMESFFAVLKKELIYLQNYKSIDSTRLTVFEYIEVFYNRRRIHSGINYNTPIEFERLWART